MVVHEHVAVQAHAKALRHVGEQFQEVEADRCRRGIVLRSLSRAVAWQRSPTNPMRSGRVMAGIDPWPGKVSNPSVAWPELQWSLRGYQQRRERTPLLIVETNPDAFTLRSVFASLRGSETNKRCVTSRIMCPRRSREPVTIRARRPCGFARTVGDLAPWRSKGICGLLRPYTFRFSRRRRMKVAPKGSNISAPATIVPGSGTGVTPL